MQASRDKRAATAWWLANGTLLVDVNRQWVVSQKQTPIAEMAVLSQLKFFNGKVGV